MPMDDDLSPVFPANDIKCKTCVFRKPGKLGYRNAYCEMYPNGKPNRILFSGSGADCEFYEKELALT